MPCSVEQLSLFDEAEQECEPELLEEITYKRAKKKQKGTLEIKLDNLKHIKEVYDIDEKDRICDICGTKMHRVGEEFVMIIRKQQHRQSHKVHHLYHQLHH